MRGFSFATASRRILPGPNEAPFLVRDRLRERVRAHSSEGELAPGKVSSSPDLGIDEPLTAVADRYALDIEAVRAAAQMSRTAPI